MRFVVFFPMVVSQSSFPPLSRPQTPDSPSLPPNFHRLPGSPFVISLHPYFITSSAATQDRPQPPSPHSLAHTFHHTRGVLPCTSSFDFPISNFVFSTASATPLSVTLTDTPQLHENKATLSPAFATLTGRVKHKSFVCHSYKKHRGVGYPSILKQFPFVPRLLCKNRSANTPDMRPGSPHSPRGDA